MNPGHHVWKCEYLMTFLHKIYHFHLSGNYSRSIFLLLHVTLKWIALSVYTYRFYQIFESCWWLMVNASSSLFSDVYTGALSLFAQPYPVVTLGETVIQDLRMIFLLCPSNMVKVTSWTVSSRAIIDSTSPQWQQPTVGSAGVWLVQDFPL